MRWTALFIAGVLYFGFLSTASAQTVTIDTAVRNNSPRVADSVIRGLAVTAPVGLRDCSCEVWTFTGSYSGGTITPDARFEFWVGKTPDACATLENRAGSGTLTPSCWQIPQDVAPSQPVAPSFAVTIPTVVLLNPVDRQCTPPAGRDRTGSLYFTVLALGPVTMTPHASQQIDYNLDPPYSPANVGVLPQDGAAQVTWANFDTSPALQGFYVMCFPGAPPSFDAGLVNTCSTPVFTGDSGDAVDAAALGDVVDERESHDAGDAAPACSLANVPSTFDPADDAQFNRYRCSTLLSRSTTSFVVGGLTNGSAYRFAVVSQDTAGNRSGLNAMTDCLVPQPAVDVVPRGCACSTIGARERARGIVPVLGMLGGLSILARRKSRRGRRSR